MRELKNLERTNFNWFGVNEIKDLDKLSEQQIKELKKFSFAPFTYSWIYSFIRTNWDFLLLRYVGIIVFYIFYMIFYFVFLFSSLKELFLNGAEGSLESFEGFSYLMNKGFTLVFVAVGLFLVLLFAAEICECFFARRLSWNRLSWKDFESFQYSESQWNIAGLVFLLLRLLGIIAIVAILIVVFKFLPSTFKELNEAVFHI